MSAENAPVETGVPVAPAHVHSNTHSGRAADWTLNLSIARGSIARRHDVVEASFIRDDGTRFECWLLRRQALYIGELLHHVAEPMTPSPSLTELLQLAAVYVSAARWGGLLPGFTGLDSLHAGMRVRPYGMSWSPGAVEIVSISDGDDGRRDALVRRVIDATSAEPYPMVFHDHAGGYEVVR